LTYEVHFHSSLQSIRVKFVYEGHRVKITVTRAKKTFYVIPPPLHLSESMVQLSRQRAHCVNKGRQANMTIIQGQRRTMNIHWLNVRNRIQPNTRIREWSALG